MSYYNVVLLHLNFFRSHTTKTNNYTKTYPILRKIENFNQIANGQKLIKSTNNTIKSTNNTIKSTLTT